jgi:hypothetical protein
MSVSFSHISLAYSFLVERSVKRLCISTISSQFVYERPFKIFLAQIEGKCPSECPGNSCVSINAECEKSLPTGSHLEGVDAFLDFEFQLFFSEFRGQQYVVVRYHVLT